MTVQEILGLTRPPIAVGLFDEQPQNIKKWEGQVPAGCVFWQKAWDGLMFYTVPSDHYNCVIGCHTHHIDLSYERKHETDQTIDLMIKNKYLLVEDIPKIPTLKDEPKYIVYGPAEQTLFKPSVVILAVKPSQAMIVYEAAIRAGIGNPLMNVFGRPGCATIPLTLDVNSATLSLGCKGNRVNSGLPDDEMYITIPGDKWEALSRAIIDLHEANANMELYFIEHKAKIPVFK